MTVSLQVRGSLARDGTVRGRTFLHADLGFQYVFPDAWRIYKGTDDVVGLSPVQDGIIRLRLFPGTPDEAALAFFSEIETESGPTAQETINGLSALTAGFRIDTGNWAVRGLATFLACDGRTYVVTGSTTSEVFDHYRAVLRESLESFDRLPSAGGSADEGAVMDEPLRAVRRRR